MPPDLFRLVQRVYRDSHDGGRAVRVCDDSLVLERIFRIDFRDHQRNGVNHAERAGVVNHHAAGIHAGFRKCFGCGAARTEESIVNAFEGVFRQLFHCDLFALEFEFFTGGTR